MLSPKPKRGCVHIYIYACIIYIYTNIDVLRGVALCCYDECLWYKVRRNTICLQQQMTTLHHRMSCKIYVVLSCSVVSNLPSSWELRCMLCVCVTKSECVCCVWSILTKYSTLAGRTTMRCSSTRLMCLLHVVQDAFVLMLRYRHTYIQIQTHLPYTDIAIDTGRWRYR